MVLRSDACYISLLFGSVLSDPHPQSNALFSKKQVSSWRLVPRKSNMGEQGFEEGKKQNQPMPQELYWHMDPIPKVLGAATSSEVIFKRPGQPHLGNVQLSPTHPSLAF